VARVLVVANETVGAGELLDEIRRIEAEGHSTYYVVAPAHPADHKLTATWTQEGAVAAAQERLDATLEILRSEGLEAGGAVGDLDPLNAVRDALIDFDADLIVISTHPPARSRWLKRDLVGQVGHETGKPVHHVVSYVAAT
jgi:GABA permease